MKEIRVSIIDRNTLKLLEDAKEGDVINLASLTTIDKDNIDKVIEDNYKEKLNYELSRQEKVLKANNDKVISENELQFNQKIAELKEQINKLNYTISSLNKEKDTSIQLKVKELESKINKENEENILNLKEQINKLTLKLKNQSEADQLKFDNERKDLINKNNLDIANIKNEFAKFKEISELALQNKLLEKDNDYKKIINDKEKEIELLKLQKTHLGTKELGEDLEKWCNSEYDNYATSGFENAKWYKDNVSIKEDDELKGTKADYIFEVYSDCDFKKENLLTSVCCEIKNEGIDSKYKKKNSDHYDKLDKDRKKKNCEYALLISTLELDNNNDAPIKKVQGYEKMYLVRPQYFISFLSLLYSLSNKYADILKTNNEQIMEFKDRRELEELFDKLKDTYIEKPLIKLENDVKEAYNNSLKIESLNNKNKEILNGLIFTDIQTIKDKILKFDIRKIGKKLDKLDS